MEDFGYITKLFRILKVSKAHCARSILRAAQDRLKDFLAELLKELSLEASQHIASLIKHKVIKKK